MKFNIKNNIPTMERDFREVVQSWLDGNFDEATKAQILALQENDPVELEDAFYRNLEFGTGGLRGIMGVGTNRMNTYTVGMATQGLANYMKANCEGPLSVCISFDSRNNSPEFAQIAANVLAANGIHVYIYVSILLQTPLPSRLPHDIEQSSMCCTIDPCWLSTLNIQVCTCPSQTP